MGRLVGQKVAKKIGYPIWMAPMFKILSGKKLSGSTIHSIITMSLALLAL